MLWLVVPYLAGIAPVYALGRYWFPAIWRSLMVVCALLWPFIVWLLFVSFVFDVIVKVLKEVE